MIRLTRLGGQEFVLNADLIERLDATPDTTITLVNGHHYMVREAIDEVLERIVAAHQTTQASLHVVPPPRTVLRLVREPDGS